MGGMFGVVFREEREKELGAVDTLCYGVDYHSHLATRRGGMVTVSNGEFFRYIHDITNASFRSKFRKDMKKFRGKIGIGAISDYEDQPLVISSHLGRYAIVSVNRITNLDDIVRAAFRSRKTHFAETGKGEINPTEVIATLINQEDNYVSGIENSQETVRGSNSLLLMTPEGIYAARDRLGRTPLVIGKKDNAYAVTSETGAFLNLGFEDEKELGPGETVFISPDGIETKKKAGENMQICSFLWVYFGYPSSDYEGINVEETRYRCGAELAKADREDLESERLKLNLVAGIPDSGTGHAIGYANESRIPYKRPFVKYTPSWPRSFMPPNQEIRDIIAKMKLIPIKRIIDGQSLLFCEDSIVRGTQLRDIIERLYQRGAREIHMRPACPPLIYGCEFLNFSRSKSANELAGQRAIRAIRGIGDREEMPGEILEAYSDPDSDKYHAMTDWIRDELKLTSLKYQRLPDLVSAIGLPKEKLCTFCWDGCRGCK